MAAEATTTAAPAAEEDQYNGASLSGRELEWAVNSPELIASHKKINGSIIRTRFPPEPNGYVRYVATEHSRCSPLCYHASHLFLISHTFTQTFS